MSEIRGVQHRPRHLESVPLQGRVHPETHAGFHAAAKASGVSVSYYLDLYFQELKSQGKSLPIVQPPKRRKESLTDAA